jgi:predicted permease
MPDWKNAVEQQLAKLKLVPTREAEIVEELTQHLEDRYQELLRYRVTPEKAYQITLAELPGNELLTEQLRQIEQQAIQESTILGAARTNMIADLWQDLRYGVRMLRKNPGFTLIAVLTLALGIGANTAIFSVVNTLLLNPLPYPDAEQLVMIYSNTLTSNQQRTGISVPEFADYHQTDSFESVGAFDYGNLNISADDGGAPERVESVSVTPEIFSLLKITPLKGRIFLPEEAQANRDRVVIISHALWQRRFGGDETLVGKNILINGRNHTVVGIMPSGFAFPQQTELWKPLWFPPKQYEQQQRGARGLLVLGRLKAGISFAQAQAEMTNLNAQFAAQYPQSYGEERPVQISLVPLLEDFVGDMRPALRVLIAAVLLVLLIACANVANLLLVRATARQQEIAIRFALGAERSRVLRQLLTESLLLALAGGATGALLAMWGIRFLLKFAPENLPRFQQVSIDGRVLLFTCAASLLTGIVFGIIPALTALRTDLNATLKESGRSNNISRHRVRDVFVVAQVAAALVLLAGAGLLIKSFWRLQSVDPGFNPNGVLTMRMLLPFETYPKDEQRAGFYRQILTQIRTLPGVESAAVITRTPLFPGNPSGAITGENSVISSTDTPVEAERRSITPEYFQAMGITLIKGRAFTDADTAGAPLTAIVDETFAQLHWPNQDAIGKRIKSGGYQSQSPWIAVVGVVRHVKSQRFDIASNVQTYFPFYQDPGFFSMSLVIRTSVDNPLLLSNAVRAAIQSVDRNQPVFLIKTMPQLVDESLAQQRLSLLLMSVFATVALLLAAIGLYGVMSYTVSQRTHEIGLRMALGAQTRNVLALVLRQGLVLVAVGMTIGLLVAFALTRLMQTVLFDVSASDPMTFTVIAVLLLLIALFACWIPARRATRVDPMVALRAE